MAGGVPVEAAARESVSPLFQVEVRAASAAPLRSRASLTFPSPRCQPLHFLPQGPLTFPQGPLTFQPSTRRLHVPCRGSVRMRALAATSCSPLRPSTPCSARARCPPAAFHTFALFSPPLGHSSHSPLKHRPPSFVVALRAVRSSISRAFPAMPASVGLLRGEGQPSWPLLPLFHPSSSSAGHSSLLSVPVVLSLSPAALACVLLMLAVVSALSASSPRVRLRLWAAAARGLRWLVDVVAWQLRSLSCSLMPWQWLQRSVHCQPVYLLAVSVFHAPPSWRVSSERFRVIAGGHFRLPPATVSFCSKILANSGLGENTAFPRCTHARTQHTHRRTTIPPHTTRSALQLQPTHGWCSLLRSAGSGHLR